MRIAARLGLFAVRTGCRFAGAESAEPGGTGAGPCGAGHCGTPEEAYTFPPPYAPIAPGGNGGETMPPAPRPESCDMAVGGGMYDPYCVGYAPTDGYALPRGWAGGIATE